MNTSEQVPSPLKTNLSARGNKLSIYIHWPYCLAKCPYCDFNSYSFKHIDYELWENAYLAELQKHSNFLRNKTITSVFFGGGTPSLMKVSTVEKILNFIALINKNILPTEVTLEANPSTIEVEKFKNLKTVGINRISIGIQSFNQQNLQFLGRNHNVNEAQIALDLANTLFERVSFDLICALPHQELQSWLTELNYALKFFKEHISIYHLTIEPNTVFYTKNIPTISEEKGAEFFIETITTLAQHNIKQYEISNFSTEHKESIHNLNYWEGGFYLGIGPGAYGKLYYNQKFISTEQIKNPKKWCDQVLKNSTIFSDNTFNVFEELSTLQRFEEVIMTYLRLNKCIPKDLSQHLSPAKIKFLIENKLLLKNHNSEITTTLQGKLLLNYVISQLLVE